MLQKLIFLLVVFLIPGRYNVGMHKAQKQTSSGFTLIELIIVMALTVFLMTVTAVGFVSSASQFSFSNADGRIQEMIREARSLAISGKAQPDYTNYAHAAPNQCTLNGNTLTNSSDPTDPCLATPAHYGVNFQSSVANPPTYTVTLFADTHNPAGCTSNCGEGQFNPGVSPTDYQKGLDIVLDQYTVPDGMQLIIPMSDGTTLPGNGTSATIFFSPIFADVSTDIIIPSTSPFFRFGISQTVGQITRKRCSEIHLLAGISEPMTLLTPPSGPTYCP